MSDPMDLMAQLKGSLEQVRDEAARAVVDHVMDKAVTEATGAIDHAALRREKWLQDARAMDRRELEARYALLLERNTALNVQLGKLIAETVRQPERGPESLAAEGFLYNDPDWFTRAHGGSK